MGEVGVSIAIGRVETRPVRAEVAMSRTCEVVLGQTPLDKIKGAQHGAAAAATSVCLRRDHTAPR